MKKGILLVGILVLLSLAGQAQQPIVQSNAPMLQAPVQAVTQPPATGTEIRSTTSNAIQGNPPVSAQTPQLPGTTQTTKPTLERQRGKTDPPGDDRR